MNLSNNQPKQIGTETQWKSQSYQSQYQYKECHKGNTLLLTSTDGKGGLYAAGFLRGIDINGYYVIDLTGSKYKAKKTEIEVYDEVSEAAFSSVLSVEETTANPLGWLSLPIEDMQVPDFGLKTWAALADDILKLMNEDKKIVITCLGGHGRTGVACAIIGYLLASEGVGDNPVEWIRKVHCEQAVETTAQVDYVFKTLEPAGLPQGKRMSTLGSKSSSAYSTQPTTYVTDTKGNLVPKKELLPGKDDKKLDEEFDKWYDEHYPISRWEYD